MNAKKMFGLLACAAASAVAFNAYANTTTNWFGVSASGTDLTLTTATTNGAAVTVSNGKITIDNEYSTLLSIAPETASPALNDGLVTITSTAVLTPCDASNLPDSSTITDAKVGFAVAYDGAATNYYYYASSTWTATETVVADPEAATTFTITMDYRTKKAAFAVGATPSTIASNVTFVSSSTTLTDIAAFGSGSISSIAAKYEVAVCAVVEGSTTNKYGSVADAKTAGGSTSTIVAVNSSGTVAESATAANGLSSAVCMALGLSTTDSTANITVAPPATDTDTTKITLAVSLPSGAEADAVKFVVSDGSSSSEYTDASAIKVPLSAGTYTITPTLK